MSNVYRGRWTVVPPETKGGVYVVGAKDETAKGGGFAVRFEATHRELVALRTALAAALTAPRVAPPVEQGEREAVTFNWHKSGRSQIANVCGLLVTVSPLPLMPGRERAWRVGEIFGAHWLVSGEFANVFDAQKAAEKMAIALAKKLGKWSQPTRRSK